MFWLGLVVVLVADVAAWKIVCFLCLLIKEEGGHCQALPVLGNGMTTI